MWGNFYLIDVLGLWHKWGSFFVARSPIFYLFCFEAITSAFGACQQSRQF